MKLRGRMQIVAKQLKYNKEKDIIIKYIQEFTSRNYMYKYVDTMYRNGKGATVSMERITAIVKYKADKSPASLMYDVTYMMLYHDIDESSANKYIADFKANKSTSRESFVRRWGEYIGSEKFKAFQVSSAKSKDINYYIEKYGIDEGTYMLNDINSRCSKRCIGYWTHRGYSLEDAKEEVSRHQKHNSGLHKEYWYSRGFDKDEVDVIFSRINSKKGLHPKNIKLLKETYGNSWEEYHKANYNKMRKKMEACGKWIPLSLMDDWGKYKQLVSIYTNVSIRSCEGGINNLELRGVDFHLDHRYSIKMGFINDIPPEIIGSIYNLEIIPAKINCSKRAKCSITKEFLIKEYNEGKKYKKE